MLTYHEEDLRLMSGPGRLAPRRRRRDERLAPSHLGRLLRSAEAREQRQAAFLHDCILQDLYGLRLAAACSSPGDVVAHLDTLADRVRHLTDVLMPPSLEAYGLAEALRTHVLESEPGLDVRLHVTGGGDEPAGPRDVFLLRIVQEALSNVARHASTEQASVALRHHRSAVSLQICDAGAGFEVPGSFRNFASEGRFGLFRAQAYARAAGGKLSVVSSPGAGTVLTARVPTLTAPDL